MFLYLTLLGILTSYTLFIMAAIAEENWDDNIKARLVGPAIKEGRRKADLYCDNLRSNCTVKPFLKLSTLVIVDVVICHVIAVSHIVQRRGTKTRVATKFLTFNFRTTKR